MENFDRQKAYIEDRYGDGECADFAQALHQLLGYPVVLLRCVEDMSPALPLGFPRHPAVRCGDGLFMDAFGIADINALEQRFSLTFTVDYNPDMNRCPFDDDDDIGDALEHAGQLLKYWQESKRALLRAKPPFQKSAPYL
jgi:hypothetical protein